MRVALPRFGTRVSPRCRIASDLILAEIEDGAILARQSATLDVQDEDDLADRVLELGVDVLVCGGIRREAKATLVENGVCVLDNVAGEAEEILHLLAEGRLSPGHGLRVETPPEEAGAGGDVAAALPAVDCIACTDRTCRTGGTCALAGGSLPRPPATASEERWLDVGRDLSAQNDPKLCRIAELVHFAVGMGYHRVGVAFCWELFRETETLCGVLSRFFTVTPVCCRVASGNVPDGAPPSRFGAGSPCNPQLMARVLSEAGTELNVIAGLCLGCDLVFAERSRAPVTTLFVKDRTLSHNPVAAIYTRYYLEDLK